MFLVSPLHLLCCCRQVKYYMKKPPFSDLLPSTLLKVCQIFKLAPKKYLIVPRKYLLALQGTVLRPEAAYLYDAVMLYVESVNMLALRGDNYRYVELSTNFRESFHYI